MVAMGLLTMKIMCRETKQRLLAGALALGLAQGVAAQDYNDQPTPEELAKLGLKRDDIPRYVFRDMFYV